MRGAGVTVNGRFVRLEGGVRLSARRGAGSRSRISRATGPGAARAGLRVTSSSPRAVAYSGCLLQVAVTRTFSILLVRNCWTISMLMNVEVDVRPAVEWEARPDL